MKQTAELFAGEGETTAEQTRLRPQGRPQLQDELAAKRPEGSITENA